MPPLEPTDSNWSQPLINTAKARLAIKQHQTNGGQTEPKKKGSLNLRSLKIRNTVARISKYATNINAIGALLAGLKGKPTALNLVGVAASLIGMAASHLYQGSLIEQTTNWEHLKVPGVDLRVWLRAYKTEQVGDHILYSFNGHTIIQHEHGSSEALIESGSEIFFDDLAEMMWSTYNDSVCISGVIGNGHIFDLETYVPESFQESDRGQSIWDRLEPFIDAGDPRSMLLNGDPGVGKSTIVRYLTSKVPGRILRIPTSEVGSFSLSALTGLVRFLKPSVIVIDDIDRASGIVTQMLDFFEHSRKDFKLLLVTTNSLASMDPAVLRPLRFDEVMSVSGLGDTFVHVLLGDDLWVALSEEQQQDVMEWPAAYLQELYKRFHMIRNVNISVEFNDLKARKQHQCVPSWAAYLQAQQPLPRGGPTEAPTYRNDEAPAPEVARPG